MLILPLKLVSAMGIPRGLKLYANHPRLSAFSLVEVVLALGIVSFAFLTLLALFPIGLQSEKMSTNETSAVNLMHSIIGDLSTTPLTSGTTNTIASTRFGISPLPGNVTSALATTNYLNDAQQRVATAAGAQYRVIMNYAPAGNTVGAYSPPSVLVQIFWPASAATNNAQGFYESYATFPPYSL